MRHLHTAPSPESRVSLCSRATELSRLRFASRSTWLAPLAAALLLGAASAASAQTYTFVSIADNTGPFVDFQVPSINNAGTVVFNAFLADGEQRIVTGPDPVADVIATTAGPYDIFEFALPVINDAGTALFLATLDAGGEGYFTGPDPVADAFITSAGPFDFFLGPATNNTGTAVVHAILDDGSEGLFTGPNPATDTVVSSSDGTYAFFGNPNINNAGTVAFAAARIGGGQAIATGPNPADIVANTDGNYFGFADPDINDAGRVVFIASLDDGSYSGIFDGPDPVADAVITTQGPYLLITDFQSLNNEDLLVFGASLDSAPTGKGIFTGPDPVADKIIYTGDALFGSTLTNFFFNNGLNDRGDVAFFYELADGRIGIALALAQTSFACPLPLTYWRAMPDLWPVDTLTLGSQSYDKAELLGLVNTRVNSSGSTDASLVLAHQLIAAKLNVANGSDPAPVSSTIADGDALLNGFVGKLPYGVPRSSEEARSMAKDANLLSDYNHGNLTPGCGP